MKKNPGILYIVATPIGDPQDITLRAIKVLNETDAVICEEYRIGSTLMKKLGVKEKELVILNEHNEKEIATEIIQRLLTQGQNFALVSDCGTPVFADPGHFLISQAVEFGVSVIPIPGVSSLMATLSILDFKLNSFIFGGFLPRQPEQRREALVRMRAAGLPVVLMDTPYRLVALLDDVSKTFGKNARITLACNLTLPTEFILRGSVAEVCSGLSVKKAEFILVIH